MDVYEQLKNWSAPSYNKDDFIQDLPELSKEKHWKVLGELIDVIESVLNEKSFQNVDLTNFYFNFLDSMMSNAKGESQTKLDLLIPQLWDAIDNKTFFIQQINKHLGAKQPKILEKSCNFLEILILNGNIEELLLLKPLQDSLFSLTKQKSPQIRKAVIKVFKEAYLWMGDKFQILLNNPKLDDGAKTELQKYIDGVSKLEMKVGQKKEKKKLRQEKEIIESELVQKETPQSKDHGTMQSTIQFQKTNVEQPTFQSEVVKPRMTKDLMAEVHVEELDPFETFDELKESLFSEKNLKLENVIAQQKIVIMHMRQAMKMTEDFQDCNKIQLKFLYQILEKLLITYPNAIFGFELHQIYALFIIQQMQQQRREELFQLIGKYWDSENKIIQSKDGIANITMEIMKKPQINDDFVYGFCRLIETELVQKKPHSQFPIKLVAQFFSKGQFNDKQKKRIFNLV